MKNIKLNKTVSYILTAALAFIVVCAAAFIFQFYVPVDSVKNEETVRVEIPAGTSTKKIASILKQKKLIRSEQLFYLNARFPLMTFRVTPYLIKSGVYTVKSSMSMSQILTLMESGQQEYIKILIPEGLTMRKIGEMLEEEKVCSSQHFINACKNLRLVNEYKIPAESFEGFLFPDTYFLTPGMDPETVVCLMVNNFISKVSDVDGFKDRSISDYYNTVVLASIVEREYRVPEEAPLIASVFKNRIEENTGLYSCATIEYIITEILGRPHPDVITYDDLKIDSPYNTYKWAGLTPGPISNPGLIALKAAANPPKTDYFYFTLTDSNKGTHTFSKSFSSHTQAGVKFKTKKAASSK